MIVAVINIKGGVGKPPPAMALATAAVRDGRAATVLDTDAQSSASMWDLAAEEAGNRLPFEVAAANIASLRRLDGDRGRFVVIDTPPTGKITDEAKDAADFVVVPTSPNGIDLQQTYTVVSNLEEVGKPYAVLITRAEPRTIALRSAERFLVDADVSTFDTVIRKRADLGNVYGQPFGDDLYGYGEVYEQLKEAMANGDQTDDAGQGAEGRKGPEAHGHARHEAQGRQS